VPGLATGYLRMFTVAEGLGKILFIMVYEGITSGSRKLIVMLILFLIYPVVFGVVVKVRSATSRQLQSARGKKWSEVAKHSVQAITNVRLINSYDNASWNVKRFIRNQSEFYDSQVAIDAHSFNSNQIAVWLVTLSQAAYLIWSAYSKLHYGTPTLGTVTVTLTALSGFGNAYGSLYGVMLSVVGDFNDVTGLWKMMNGTTTDKRQRAKYESAIEVSKQHLANGKNVAALPLTIVDHVTEKFHIVPQGLCYAVVGPRSEGKSKVLWLLASQVSFGRACAFIPQMLRVIFCSASPRLVHSLSLLGNLVYGLPKVPQSFANMGKASALCTRLGATERLLAMLQQDTVLPWMEWLSGSERKIVGIVRALLAAPDVLLLAEPTRFLDATDGNLLTGMLREYVAGTLVEAGTMLRPRTVIFTALTRPEVELSDKVMYVSVDGVVIHDRKDEITDSDLATATEIPAFSTDGVVMH